MQFLCAFAPSYFLGKENGNFFMYSGSEGETFGLPYDYKSIMHYQEYSSSKNGQITIETLDPSMQKVMSTFFSVTKQLLDINTQYSYLNI